MKRIQQLAGIIISLLFFIIIQNVHAQPPNDECVNAIDISAAFAGSCGDVLFNGPFTLTGSTPGANDPPEPGEAENYYFYGPFCPDETDPFLFGDDSPIWENSVWYTWTVPDLNGDGSNVSYSIWTSDGSFGDDCGIVDPLLGDSDTQVAIYEGPDCPNASTGECDHYAANEDLFTSPPWISGWLSLEFTPGVTYYMGVDGWDGVEGEFCLTTVVCGVECGDSECAPVEDYCDCQADCPCIFGDIALIEFVEDDPAIPGDNSGYFFSNDLQGNVFFCSDFVTGAAGENTYLGFGAQNWTDCTGNSPQTFDVSLSAGQFLAGATDNGDGTVNIPVAALLFIELTPADIAAGSIIISGSTPDGLGSLCEETITINFADFPQATDPFCTLSCFAGDIDPDLLNNGITVCEGQTFDLSTDGLEDLSLPCNSDDGSSYVYAWRLLVDLYGTGIFEAVASWQVIGTNPTVDPMTFFIDEFGYVGPYYTPGYPISPPQTMQIQGAALCINADGTFADGCTSSNEVTVTFLPADDPLCNGMDVAGCIDDMACNYNPDATVDDGSCTYPEPNFDCNGNCLVELDCAGECGGTAEQDCEDTCGGSATEGTVCTDANGEAGIYAADCSCITGDCEEEITGSITSADPLCDLSGINIIITAPDGTTTTVSTGADGTFTVPGGPFPCGTYTASFEDISVLPSCYTDSGPTAPISFNLDGNPNTMDGPFFTANPTIPTLSQWGLMVLALLLMSFGAIQLFISSQKTGYQKYRQ